MVFEEQVAFYLDKYLGKFVKGLSKEALKISVWAGNVELTNMQLKPEALNALKLPIKVKAGFLGSVKLKVPWSRLGKEPVVVFVDKIFLLAEPATNVDRGADSDAVQEAKMNRVKEAERKLVEARGEAKMKQDMNNSSWLGSLISTIIGNLKLSVGNIHIRYEDFESHPGHPFAVGLTLEKLAAVTVDENGKETFVTGGSLDRIQKSAELQRLAVYFDPDTEPWNPKKKWEDLHPKEWTQIFIPGVKSELLQANGSKHLEGLPHSYILQPIGGTAMYYKLANKDQRPPDKPAQQATVTLDDVTIGLSQEQYRNILKVIENFTTFNKRLHYAHYRPSVSIKENKRAWWQYACKAVAEQEKQARGHVSWKRVLKLSQLRKKYLSLYVSSLQSGNPDRISVEDNKEILALDRDLDTDVIIQWRMLAHKYVDENRAQDQKRQQESQSWWWFGWGGQSSDIDNQPQLTDEDLEKFNQLIGYEEGKPSNILPGQDPPNMLHTLLVVHMRHNATKLVGEDQDDLLDLSCDDFHCVLHMYPKTVKFDLRLASYKFACPEGLLAESTTEVEAANATFTYLPSELVPPKDSRGEKTRALDWSLAAKASPCYVTILMPSINKVIEFFQNNRAVSQSVALETATALQTTLDEVTRNAQQQINQALKDRPRFSIDLDLAAPKVTIPTNFYPDGVQQCKLLVDLGYFKLKTELDDKARESAEENELYMHFQLQLSDVSAILVDGEYDWNKNYDKITGKFEERKSDSERASFLPVLEKCGMLVAFQQICVPHPLYPTTRVALRLPSLGFHFSPARYHRLMQVMKVFQSSSPAKDSSIHPWEPSDFEGKVSVLAWKGVGHREAVWQHRHAILTGPFLYLLEYPSAQNYKYCSSLIGKQVYNVPPEAVGDVPYVLAICDAGQFNNKVAESVNAILMRFEDESNMNGWQGRLTGAIYRTSAPTAIASFVGSMDEDDDPKGAVVEAAGPNEQLNAAEQESLFLIGVLDELKIVISNSQIENYTSKQLLLEAEIPILEFRAIGTKVEFALRMYDSSVGAVLQALEIEDKYHGHVSPSCKYLARSYIKSFKTPDPRSKEWPSHTGGQQKCKVSSGYGRRDFRESKHSESDRFFDAVEDLNSEELPPGHGIRRSSPSLSKFFDAEEGGAEENLRGQGPPSFSGAGGLLPMAGTKDQIAAQDDGLKNFVKVQVIMCSQDSPDYANVDKEVKVTLATLSFFSNRRTLLTLLDLVTAVTADIEPDDPNPPVSSTESDAIVSSVVPEAIDDSNEESPGSFQRNDSVVKGLLGRGKSRVVFLVTMDMDQAQIVLNTEDGAQLSILSVEDLHNEVKVYPASFGIKAALGNLRVSDGSLSDNHPHYYVCDMRDPQGASFIELEFLSFNKDDDDFKGFEYSIEGKLSELRIVYLNRFIQEIVSYFMGLVPQNSGYVVKLKDRVTDVEKFFNQSDIEGQPAMKLELSLNKPVIIMPRSTHSSDFLELDILHINLSNSFQWLGGGRDELGAVHLETTTLELQDLHLVVGLDGKTGEGIIQEARGLSLILRRPIRDLWHQLPAAEASVKIEKLRAALSDKEYQVITECAVSNMAETPNLPPPVMEKTHQGTKEEIETALPEPDVDPDSSNDGNKDSSGAVWTTVKVGIGIDMVELGLFTRQTREAPLATIQVAGVWASYKSNTNQEANIQATLEKFRVRDDREGTEAEMRYMIGSADDREPHKSTEQKTIGKYQNTVDKHGSISTEDCKSALTMLVMDAKLSPCLQMISMRIQHPRLLVAFDFLLAVVEFFIPSIHVMLSNGKNGGENPLDIQNAIFLQEVPYIQSNREVTLSPKTPLVADKEDFDTYVYDGRGGSIRLLDRRGANLRDFSQEVIILIGDGKKLQFKNVVIENGDYLDSCVSLGNNSSYTVSEQDGVFLEGQPEEMQNDIYSQGQSGVEGPDDAPPAHQTEDKPVVELMFDLQAVAPELTFYDSIRRVEESVIMTEKLLRARMNIFSRFVLRGDDMELNAQVNGLTVEASSGVQVVEPVDMIVKYTNLSGKQNLKVVSSEIRTNFSFSILQLICRLQVDVMSFLRITSEQTVVDCSQFDKIWADDDEKSGANCITFWRPRSPPGFAILGDCMSPRDEIPSKSVVALNMGLARVKRPVELVRVWSSDEVHSSGEASSDDDDSHRHCSVWLPVPPPGYVALGCIASPGKCPPPLNTCFCVLSALVTPSTMKDCIIITGQENHESSRAKQSSFWRVENSTGSFFFQSALDHPEKYRPYELRHVISNYDSFPVQETKPRTEKKNTVKENNAIHGSPCREKLVPRQVTSSGRIYENVARFKLVWWDKKSGSRRGVSIWRPVTPPDCVILGDVAVEGYEPPSVGLVLRDSQDRGLLSKPLYFQERGYLPHRKHVGGVSFWFPVAPPGYVALGCIASSSSSPEAEDLIRCVRSDLVIVSSFSSSSLWETCDIKNSHQELSIWQVENEAFTFFVRRGLKHPPKRLALSLADLKRPNTPDNLVIEAEVKQISATVFDDFGGLMAPLVEVSLSGIRVNIHGRIEAMTSTVSFALAATTFNGKYNAWEPLIEPWDGRVRFEYSSDPSDSARPTESKIRLAASSTLNINLSTTNLNMLLEAYASWNKLNRLEERSKKQQQFSIDSRGRVDSKPALAVESQKNLSCVNHNQLGEELFLRIVEENGVKILSLPSHGTVTVQLPTAQSMQMPGGKSTVRRQNKIVAFRIGDAEVSKDEGIGGREYMVTIQVVPHLQTSDQQQLQCQSARTRCAPPEDQSSSHTVRIHWDEIFIFEIEPEGGNIAEIVVTDVTKDAPVGSCSVDLTEETAHSSKLSSDEQTEGRIPWQSLDLHWQSLNRPKLAERKENEVKEDCGRVSFSKHFFTFGNPLMEQTGKIHEQGSFQVGPTQRGPWSPVGLNYALGAAPWTLNNDIIASEFYVDGGVKHLVIRSLVGIQNGTDFDLEVSLGLICTIEANTAQETKLCDAVGETFEEEVFENERYQPLVGWGSKWPGHLLPTDPAHYTGRDFSNPSNEFPSSKLPIGWEWTSDWHVDKVAGVDEEGWAYAFDFRNLQWPPVLNSEKVHRFVRHRRWVQSRKSATKGGSSVDLGTLPNGDNMHLPVSCLRESSADYCLQIRPRSSSSGSTYEWSKVIPFKGFPDGRKTPNIKVIRVKALVETEALLSCSLSSSSSSIQEKPIWFCLEATPTIIGKDLNMDPITEWKLVITAPIMLRNYLPVPCEYSVSEKSTNKRLIVRNRGVINPGQEAGIFHADLRKSIYLTWLPKGGWNPKKETVLLSHPYKEPADHITYSNSRTSRSLRVIIDHDHDETGVAAKIVRLYVPCWLDSATCPPLQYRLLAILQQGDSVNSYEDAKVGNIIDQVNFEEMDMYPTMLSEMDPKTGGISVAINTDDGQVQFGPVFPLAPLDNPDGCVDLGGPTQNGSSFRFLVSTSSCPFDFAKTKVVRIRPYILFTNRLGEALYLKQNEVEDYKLLEAFGWRKSFSFASMKEPELLQIKLDGYEWSYPFAIENEKTIVIPIFSSSGEKRLIRVDIRGYEEGSRFSVTFRLGSTRGPYRLENRTASTQFIFRQVGLDDAAWQQLEPHATRAFAWENPLGEKLLEVLANNGGSSESMKYQIDTIGDHPKLALDSDSNTVISIRVIELLEIKTVRFFNEVVELEDISDDEEIAISGTLELTQEDESQNSVASSQVEVVINIDKLGLSVTDQHPREILYLALDNVIVSYEIGFGERTSRLKLRVGYFQLDNQLPLSSMPVLIAPEKMDESKDFLLKASLVMYDDNVKGIQVYPHVGLQVESAFRINVHEPIIWALVEMYNNVHLDRLSEDSEVVQVDPEIRIDLIDLSAIRLKLTLETAAGARPRGMLGIWSPIVTTLGNTNKMPIQLGSVLHHSRYMRKSTITSAIFTRIRRDLIHHPLQLLSGVDVLGMTSSTLGTLSQGAAELSSDGKYLRLRSMKDRVRNVAGLGDGIIQGTEALARGFGYGLTGIVTKPITNARQYGFLGFFQGVGKAALGFIMLPVSGILDFVSLTVNGVGVTCTNCLEIFEREPNFKRRRLPRAIHGDGILYQYIPRHAAGQAILQLAQSRPLYGIKGVFSEPAKFAWSDQYEDHFELPRNRFLILTNRRALMLGRPKSHFQDPKKTFSDPSNILWDVSWRNLLAVEITVREPCLILHLRRSNKSFAKVVRCQTEDVEAGISHSKQVFAALHHLWKKYGPDRRTLAYRANRKRRQSGLVLTPKSERLRAAHSKDEGYQERTVKSSNGEHSALNSTGSFTKEVVLFQQIWTSERQERSSCCGKSSPAGDVCTIWRPIAPEGYVSVGDIAHIGSEAPTLAMTYKNEGNCFAPPLSYDLIWRNWKDGFSVPVSFWSPKAPEGYVAVGCVAVADYLEPDPESVWCVREDLTEATNLQDLEIWRAPSSSPWHCFVYPITTDCLTFLASREEKEESNRRFLRVKAPNNNS